MQHCPASILLEKEPQLVLEGLPKEAVDERVEAAVGEGRQADNMSCQRVVVPQRAAICLPPQEVSTNEHILWEPANEEHQYSGRDHPQGFLPTRPLG